MNSASPPAGHALTLTVEDQIATITLTRPDVGNAINEVFAAELLAAVEWLAGATKDVRAVIVASTGRLFCAGGDVGEMAKADDPSAYIAALAAKMHEALLVLRELAIPIVTVIQGPAAGAGVALVLAGDLAVASTSATFRSAYGAIGLSPDCGVTALLPSAVGSRRAALFTLTDIVLSAEQAQDWGLITHVSAPEDLGATVDSIVMALASRPGQSAGETARLTRQFDGPLARQLEDEAQTISALSATSEAAGLIERFASRVRTSAGGM